MTQPLDIPAPSAATKETSKNDPEPQNIHKKLISENPKIYNWPQFEQRSHKIGQNSVINFCHLAKTGRYVRTTTGTKLQNPNNNVPYVPCTNDVAHKVRLLHEN